MVQEFTGLDRVNHPRNALRLLAPFEALQSASRRIALMVDPIQTRGLLHHGLAPAA